MLDDIRKRPAIYIGAKTLTGLFHFLGGYQFARIEHDVSDNHLCLPNDIHDWIAYRLHFRESTSGWHSMILERTTDESLAFDRFFALLDEHKARIPTLRARVRGIQCQYTQITNGVSEDRVYPASVSIVTYTDDPGFFVYSDDPENAFPRFPFYPSLDSLKVDLELDRSNFEIIDPDWKQVL